MSLDLEGLFITRIKVSNFKSFKELDIELDKFNVVIGSNGSGKSNFVQIIQFLKDISEQGLDNAISLQGGEEHLRNVVVGSSEELAIQVNFKGYSPIKFS